MAALALATAAFTFVLVAFVVGKRELRALVPIRPQALREPLVVVIPARDERHNIARCVQSILLERSPELRVVVVDDRSTDDTAREVQRIADGDARVTLLRLDDDPAPGVFGKPRALAAAIDHARKLGMKSRLLAFIDADVVVSEGALGGLVQAFDDSRAVALSGVPRLITESAIEQVLVPTLASMVTSPYLPSKVHDAKSDVAFLNGQLIVVDESAFAAVGGFPTDTVLEDVALAKRLKQAGHALRLADLRAVASTRMYSSFAEIAEGFGKNAVALLGKRAGLFAMFALAMSTLPWAALAIAGVDVSARGVDAWGWAALALVVITMITQGAARAMSGAPVWPVVVLPLSYAGAAFVLVRASWRALRRGVTTWKGREYRS